LGGKCSTISASSVYHDLNAYSRVFPSIFSSLYVQQPHTLYDYELTLLSVRNSTVKVAPKAFCHPNLYLKEESYPNLTYVHYYLNGTGDNVGFDSSDGVFEIRAAYCMCIVHVACITCLMVWSHSGGDVVDQIHYDFLKL